MTYTWYERRFGSWIYSRLHVTGLNYTDIVLTTYATVSILAKLDIIRVQYAPKNTEMRPWLVTLFSSWRNSSYM